MQETPLTSTKRAERSLPWQLGDLSHPQDSAKDRYSIAHVRRLKDLQVKDAFNRAITGSYLCQADSNGSKRDYLVPRRDQH